MCTNLASETVLARPPEDELSRMLASDLGVSVDPKALRMFLRYRWTRVSSLAHRIHDDA